MGHTKIYISRLVFQTESHVALADLNLLCG